MTSTTPENPHPVATGMEQLADLEVRATWLLLPLASYLVWAVFAIVWWLGFGIGTISLGVLGLLYLDVTGLLGLVGIFALAASLGSSFVLYAIMNRNNVHSARAQILFSKAMRTLEARIGPESSPALFALDSAERNLQLFTYTERDRSAFLWALLAMIPFIGWIFIIVGQWLVSKDLAKHARLENIVFDDVDRTMRAAGLVGFQVSNVQIHQRNSLALIAILACFIGIVSSLLLGFEGALILVYLTVGVISLVWIDLSAHDPRRHFRYYSVIANEIVRSLNVNMGPDGSAS